jgi:hypothetical protein
MRRSSCTSATCGRCAASISRAERARWLFAADRPQSLESQRGTARCCEEQEFSPLAAVTAFDDVLSGVPLHVTHLRGSSAVPVRASKFVSVRDLSSNRHQSHQRRQPGSGIWPTPRSEKQRIIAAFSYGTCRCQSLTHRTLHRARRARRRSPGRRQDRFASVGRPEVACSSRFRSCSSCIPKS